MGYPCNLHASAFTQVVRNISTMESPPICLTYEDRVRFVQLELKRPPP